MSSIDSSPHRANFFLTNLAELDPTTNDTFVDELRAMIRVHNLRYYEKADPIIDDQTYDALFALLKKREERIEAGGGSVPADSPTRMIGGIGSSGTGTILEGFQKVRHDTRLLSLQNTYSTEDIEQWWSGISTILEKERPGDVEFIVEPKLDGSSLELLYAFGVFVQAITRGDGTMGEDITAHCMNIASIPKQIDHRSLYARIRIRGEMVLPVREFERINTEILDQGGEGAKLFSNPRNTVAGTLRQLDTSLVESRGLVFYAFDQLPSSDVLVGSTHSALLTYLERVGFWVYQPTVICTTIDEVVALCQNEAHQQALQANGVDTDGLVIKIQQFDARDVLGETEHHPKRAFAFKYPSQEVQTVVESIDAQVGRTGVITPLARVTPVQVGGVIVSNATLHNYDMIEKMDLRVGDAIWIKRSGEVIPYVVGPVKELRDGSQKPFVLPNECPSCGSPLARTDGQVALLCTNEHCDAKRIAQLQHYVSRQAMNIVGLGDALIEQLYTAGTVHTISDLYRLEDPALRSTLRALPGLGTKSVDSAIDGINRSRGADLRRFIHGLGISSVGKKLSMIFAKYCAEQCEGGEYATLGALLMPLRDQQAVSGLFGVGSIIAQEVSDRMSAQDSVTLLKQCDQLGVHPVLPELADRSILSPVTGKTVVITGTFEQARSRLGEYIESLGGSVVSTISKKTDMIMIGESAGSKATKAEKFGTTILQYDELMQFVSDFLHR